MVVAFYRIKPDPRQLNNFLTQAGGFSDDGLIQWRRGGIKEFSKTSAQREIF
jgi:hypothetical protein